MADKKRLIDEALLDIETIQAVLKANTKEILRATMHDEINSVVKESLQVEADYDEEDVNDKPESDDEEGNEDKPESLKPEMEPEGPESLEPEMEPEGPESLEPEMGDDEGSEFDTLDLTDASDDQVISVFKKLNGSDEIEIVSDNEVIIKDPTSGAEYQVKLGGGKTAPAAPVMGIGMEPEMEPELGPEASEVPAEVTPEIEPEIGSEKFGSDEADDDDEFEKEGTDGVVYEVELTEMEDIAKSRDAIKGVPRKGGHDSRDQVKNGSLPSGNIEGQKAEQSDNYNPKGSADHSPEEGIGSAKLATGKIEGQKAKVVDRADVNTEEGFEEDAPGKKGNHAEHVMEDAEGAITDDDDNEEKVEEAIDVTGTSGTKKNSIAYQKNQVHSAVKEEVVKRYNALLGEVKALRTEREEFKANLAKFRDMLAESVVYNSNLTYMVKLFTEQSTTKDEKESIMKRFDNEVTSLKESKRLYKTIASELSTKRPIAESVIDKTNKVQTGSSSPQLTESVAYVDDSTKRIRDLISRVENR